LSARSTLFAFRYSSRLQSGCHLLMTRRWPGGRTARSLATLILVAWSGVLFVAIAAPAAAHPLGDFTVNTHVGIRVEPAAVALDVVVDIAEVPTLRAFPGLGAEGASRRGVSEADRRAYQDRLCPALLDALTVRLGDRPVAFELVDSSLTSRRALLGWPPPGWSAHCAASGTSASSARSWSSRTAWPSSRSGGGR
jgi:hypothetical protein